MLAEFVDGADVGMVFVLTYAVLALLGLSLVGSLRAEIRVSHIHRTRTSVQRKITHTISGAKSSKFSGKQTKASRKFRLIGYLPHTDHLVAAIGLGSQRVILVEMEFSISAIVNRLRDDAAEEVSVTCNGDRGIRSIYDGILRTLARDTHRAGAAVVDLKDFV